MAATRSATTAANTDVMRKTTAISFSVGIFSYLGPSSTGFTSTCLGFTFVDVLPAMMISVRASPFLYHNPVAFQHALFRTHHAFLIPSFLDVEFVRDPTRRRCLYEKLPNDLPFFCPRITILKLPLCPTFLVQVAAPIQHKSSSAARTRIAAPARQYPDLIAA